MERLSTALCVLLCMSCVYRYSSADCDDLQSADVPNGEVTTTGIVTGSTATYSCDTGYTLSGTATRTCGADGTWSGDAPLCNKDCDDLQSADVPNGEVTTTGIVTGSTATYSCDTGYTLSGTATRTCGADGTWSGDAPLCNKDCDDLQSADVPNGEVTTTGIVTGSTATYSCDTGYTLSGTATRTCGADGTWSGDAPLCNKDCDDLQSADVPNGEVTTTGIVTGSTATYSCDTGYTLSGTATRTCGADGTWSGDVPLCNEDCPALENIENGAVTSTDVTHGSTSTYTCNKGYTLSTAAPRMCDAGTWSNAEPTCIPDSFGACTGDPKTCPVDTINTECVEDRCVCAKGYYKDGDSCAKEDLDSFAMATCLTISAMIAALAIHLFF